MTETLKIETTAHAFELLSSITDSPDDALLPSVEFVGEAAKLSLYFDGPRYNLSLPSGTIKGISEFQTCIYKAAAFALYGADDIRKLTAEDLRVFELTFDVSGGSIDLSAMLTEFLTSLSNGFTSMDSKHKLICIISVALILVLGWGVTSISDAMEETKREQIKTSAFANQEAETTKQFQIFADAVSASPLATKFAESSAEGLRAIVKGSPDATKIRMGKAELNQREIVEINQRSAKESPKAEILTNDFTIFRLETKSAGLTKLSLSMQSGTEFVAILEDSNFNEDQLRALWSAAKDRKKIKLQVTVTKTKETIRNASVIDIDLPPNQVAAIK